MKPSRIFLLLIFVTISSFLISGCKKKNNNPFPSKLFLARNWHKYHFTNYTPSKNCDTTIDADFSAAVKYVDVTDVSLGGTTYYYYGNTGSKDTLTFSQTQTPSSGVGAELIYYVLADSIVAISYMGGLPNYLQFTY